MGPNNSTQQTPWVYVMTATRKPEFNGPAGHRKRLRERFLTSGRHALGDHELLELLLTYSMPRIDTKPIAKDLLNHFGSIVSVLQQPVQRLVGVKGIGPQSATLLKAIQACLTRAAEQLVEHQPVITKPEDLFAFFRLHFGETSKENVFAIYLDEARRIVHKAEVSTGTVDRVPFYAREILRPALIHNATGIILAHSHPEGEPVPSEADMAMTKRLEKTADALGIKLLDHMIVTKLQAYSIRTGKLL